MDNRQYKTKELLERFIPYFKPYRKTLFFDLFCAALTTICELVLPLIMRYITNEGLYRLAELSVQTIAGLGMLYLVLRIIDTLKTPVGRRRNRRKAARKGMGSQLPCVRK